MAYDSRWELCEEDLEKMPKKEIIRLMIETQEAHRALLEKFELENACDECVHKLQCKGDIDLTLEFEDYMSCNADCEHCKLDQLKEKCYFEHKVVSMIAHRLIELSDRMNVFVEQFSDIKRHILKGEDLKLFKKREAQAEKIFGDNEPKESLYG